jgi:membrane-bound lytic murein transglycosylase MltF
VPPSSSTEQLAREKFTGDLDELVKRRVIRVLVVADRTNLFFDGIQMRGLTYDMFRQFESGLNKKLKTGNVGVSVERAFQGRRQAPVIVKEADPNLAEDDLLEMLIAGLIEMTVARDLYAEFWSKTYADIQPRKDIVVASGESVGLAVRKNTPQLVAALNAFVKDHRVGTTYGNTVRRT